MPLIANARMYSVCPEAQQAWNALFDHLTDVTGIPLEILDHPFPLPTSDVWQRPDLACAFMCGWPWIRAGGVMQPVAAPVPAVVGRPVYWSDLIVRTDQPATTLEEMGGSRVAYTLLDSQSGFSALRHHLIELGDRCPSFTEVVGPLTTPRRNIEAVADGRADLAPIDSYAHLLLRRYLPELTDQVRVLARTVPTPIPLLVASPATPPSVVATLRAALLELRDKTLLRPLCLLGFTEPLPREEYRVMEYRAHAAEADGIEDLSEFVTAGVLP